MGPERRLRVAVVGGSDTKSGGAGRVAVDLAEALNAAGQQATHFLGIAEHGYGGHRRPLYGGPRGRAAAHWAERKLERLGLRHALPLDAAGLLAGGVLRGFDIVHFHDLGAGMSPLTIAALSRIRPVFWTFHDCSPFTGGCLYPMECRQFLARCGGEGCPQFGQWPLEGRYNLVGPLQAMRGLAHRAGRIHAIAPSEWLADAALASGKLPERPAVIPNGADTAIFRLAADRAALRAALGLPDGRPVILLTAARMDEARKGVGLALQAVRGIADLDPFVLIVGRPDPALDAALEGIGHHATGFVHDRGELARWYAAADIQLNCSLAEVQGLVVLEAMACGVPTIGFATGGMPEMIRQGETGLLVPAGDMAALDAALRRALAPGIAAGWGRAARGAVEDGFSFGHFVARHLAAYAAAVTMGR